VPRELSTDDIARIVGDYRQAARNAKVAGFDCVEIHAAHGYLIDQFFCDSTNQRTDEFGGTIDNRLRFLHLVVQAVVEVMGADRTAVRISPTYKGGMSYYRTTDSNPELLYRSILGSLDKYRLAYLLLTEPRWTGGRGDLNPATDKSFRTPLSNTWSRQVYGGNLIGSSGFTPATAPEALSNGHYDAIAFGRWFLANPDFVERLRSGADLNVYDRRTFYLRHNVKGYVDYPSLDGSNAYSSPYPTMPQAIIGITLEQAKL